MRRVVAAAAAALVALQPVAASAASAASAAMPGTACLRAADRERLRCGLQDPAPAAWQQAAQGAAFVRARVGAARCYVGQAVPVTVEIGWNRAFFAEHGATLFPRSLDLQVQALAPWFETSEDLAVLPSSTPAAGTSMSLVFNEAILRAVQRRDEVHDGKTFGVVAVELRLGPKRAGVLELPGPRLRHRAAGSFRDDFINGRTPLDPIDVEVQGDPVQLVVQELPAEGRPEDFGGAVGSFVVAARLLDDEAPEDARIQMELVVRGDGALDGFVAPRQQLADFFVLGQLERAAADARIVRYELEARRAGLTSAPSLRFCAFVPEEGRYVTLTTAPIPCTIGAPTGAAADAAPTSTGDETEPRLALAQRQFVDILPAANLPTDRGRTSPWLVAAALAAPWCAVAMAFALRRRRVAPTQVAVAAARAAYLAAAERRDSDLLQHYERYLMLRLCLSTPPADEQALRQELQLLGLAPDLVERACKLRQSLQGARYAGLSASLALVAQEVLMALDAAGTRGGRA